jgi:hypothetical protein
MLQGTAAANSKMRTPWRDAIRRRLDYLQQTGLIEIRAALRALPFDAFAWQGIFDEDDLAFVMSDAAAFVRQILDRGNFWRGLDAASGAAFQT